MSNFTKFITPCGQIVEVTGVLFAINLCVSLVGGWVGGCV